MGHPVTYMRSKEQNTMDMQEKMEQESTVAIQEREASQFCYHAEGHRITRDGETPVEGDGTVHAYSAS